MSLHNLNFGGMDLYEAFYLLIDPEDRYKQSVNQAAELLGLKHYCCISTIQTPVPQSWESYNYDLRYATGEVRTNVNLDKSKVNTFRNSKISYMNTDGVKDVLPVIQSSIPGDEEIQPYRTYDTDGIVLGPHQAIIGELDTGGGVKVPVINNIVKLADRRARIVDQRKTIKITQ